MNPRIGQQLGNYRLSRLLGRGGFAEVYLAEHTILETPVAIKLLHGRLTPQDLQDFQQEAKTLATLRHPHILRILDFGQVDELPFLVMDYAPGGTLRQQYPRGSLVPLPTIVTHVKQLAAALQHTHDAKRIHRDIKPENMLLDDRGQILLSDFGIATIAHSTSSMKTQEQIGTVHYMAPEQIQGRPRPASDQYSLGIAVYEWLCGERPFQGDSFITIAMQQLTTEPPPLCEKNPTISVHIEQAVMRALSKKPEQRYPSIQEFAIALEQAMLLATEPIQPMVSVGETPVVAVNEQPMLSSLALTPSVKALAQQVRCSGKHLLQDSEQHDEVSALAWSPNGCFITLGLKNGKILMRNANNRTNILTFAGHSGSVNTLSWSPDGRLLASGSEDKTVQIWQVWQTITGQRFRTYTSHSGPVNTLSWSPDGRLIASGSQDKTVQIWETNTGLCLRTYTGHSGPVYALSWSPDGHLLTSRSEDETVQVWQTITGQRFRTYTGYSGLINSLNWSPDGRLFASGSQDKTVQIWEANTGRVRHTYTGHSTLVEILSWSPDGRLLASGSQDKAVQVWEANTGKHLCTYTEHSTDINALSWSPDGCLIASASNKVHIERIVS